MTGPTASTVDPPTASRANGRSSERPDAPDPGRAGHNEVVLVGRLSNAVVERELPSGDVLTSWRLVVPRPDPGQDRQSRPGAPRVDTIDCSTFTARVRRRATTWSPGSWLEVRGQLRRRFWQTPGGPQSRYEVEVEQVKVLVKGPPKGRTGDRAPALVKMRAQPAAS